MYVSAGQAETLEATEKCVTIAESRNLPCWGITDYGLPRILRGNQYLSLHVFIFELTLAAALMLTSCTHLTTPCTDPAVDALL